MPFWIETTTDPVAGNNSAIASAGLVATADLSVTMSSTPATPFPGQTIVYTIVAANSGPSIVTGVTLIDIFPSVLNCSGTSVSANGASGNLEIFTGDLSENLTLPPGSYVTYTVNCLIDVGATGSLTNEVNIASATYDPVSADDKAAGIIVFGVPVDPVEVPTTSYTALILLSFILMLIGMRKWRYYP